MAKEKRRTAKAAAKAATKSAPAEGNAATTTTTSAGSWANWVYLGLSGYVFFCAGILYAIERPAAGDTAAWIIAVFVAVGVGIAAYGLPRFRAATPPKTRLDELYPPRFFLETWKKLDEEAAAERRARREAGKGWDWHPVVALLVGAVALALMEYFGGSRTFVELATWLDDRASEPSIWTEVRVCDGRFPPEHCETGSYARLLGFAWWAGWRVLGYFVIPVIAIKLSGQRIRDQGLETKGLSEHAWIYGFGFFLVLTLVTIVSYTDEFSTYYPFYKLATRSWLDFVVWELFYAAQFFSLEFFFRGWWLKTFKPVMGSYAIFAMIVPYCMIHFGKPFPETMGAIAAGVFLGTLAMKTRSIWSGFLIHVSVAVSMDMAALAQTTGLPDRLML